MSPATSGFSELRLDGVSRRFGSQDALSDLDLTIRAGEFIALLGPSGCGKSTALNCLAGLLPLTAGSIWQDERRVDTLPPERRGFGMVFQSYALFPHMSVRANVAFGLRMRRLPKDEIRRRTAEAIRLVRLEEHADKLPGQLSGGQQQRVAIARAVVLEPSLVLMDEPLSNLDAKLRLEMRTEIRRLHQSLGLTTVYVTHDQEEALSLADRLVVLRGGRVQQIGSPQELHTRPGNWHVADFMGYRNLWPMRARSVEDGLVTVEADGLRLVGDPVGRIAPGDAVIAGVRPEDVRVDAPGAPNGVPAEIEVVEYQGRELAAEARTASGVQVHVRTEQRVAPGDRVTLSVTPQRLLVFPADADEQPAAAPGDPVDAVVEEPGLVG
ncbi:spermidine/putrescine ABC transporter ATP-binding protein [Micromonospora globispora]|uniref:ABC transporter ATP-binding protein n=1 Tax=Micromonospora globispora TaxID=1450148 RepID=UPI000D6FEB0E|nr:ABC transporter ATP-binding protein [Micromonospora globispora]PWU59725.1 spermidine/putrescine ABC transporter ATP-binding protein [Micromonospora globispora]RQW82357.1 spermidine/putrescine ABC transporter ATP-binding protein [Micromonospora globispora]